MRTVAALFVDAERGPYASLPGVDVWGVERDAHRYRGPHPVVAHPACGPWGRFWWRYKGGEGEASDALRAVGQVRAYGGVLEHPAASNLWDDPERWARAQKKGGPRGAIRPRGMFRLPKPGEGHDAWGGYTLAVNQVDWGHPTIKPTWLYIVGCPLSHLPPRPPPGEPTHVIVRRVHNARPLPELPKRLRHLTPPAFAAWLVEVARRCS